MIDGQVRVRLASRVRSCQICDFQSYDPDEAKKTQTEVVDQKRRTRFDHRVGDRDRELSSSEGSVDDPARSGPPTATASVTSMLRV